MNEKKFFTHIEALRGLAILAVVLYHLLPNACPNGFLGVDIFLMITGYLLILGLLKNDGKDFSLFAFVNKKILRIFPPLLVMLIPMLLVGFWCMSSAELLLAVQTAFYSLFGWSNIFLDSSTGGYFATNSWTNPFVHTWYLSVVLQVYCLFAIIMFLVRPFSRAAKWCVVGLIGAASVGIIVYYRFILPPMHPYEGMVNLYYWTWSRLFEVVGGAFVLILPTLRWRFVRVLLTPVALAIVLYCCFASQKHLEVLLLASGVLLWGQSEGWGARLLDNPFFRFFGKYSFSIYLWHWPLIVYRNYAVESVSVWDNVFLFCGCIALGVGAYYIAEKRIWKIWLICGLWLLTLACSYFLTGNQSIDKKIHPEVWEAFHVESPFIEQKVMTDYPSEGFKAWKESNTADNVSGAPFLFQIGTPEATPSFIVMGDSHASAFLPGISAIAEYLNISGYYFPSYVTPFYDRMCIRLNFRFSGTQYLMLMEWLKKHPEIRSVVLIQRWSIRLIDNMNDESMPAHYDGSEVSFDDLYNNTELALENFCQKFKEEGRRVVIMTEVPPVKVDPAPYVRRAILHAHSIDSHLLSCFSHEYYARFARHLKSFERLEKKGVCEIVPIHQHLLKNGKFSAYEDGKVLMSDDDHISDVGAIMYAREHYKEWAALLKPLLNESHLPTGDE